MPAGAAPAMQLFVSGALFVALATVALFFARFWRRTRDRLFAWLALSFALLAAERAATALVSLPEPQAPFVYLFRLVAFVCVIVAIIEKNRGKSRGASRDGGL